MYQLINHSLITIKMKAMQVSEIEISLRDARQANEILTDRKFVDGEIVKQTSTNTYEIEMVDDETEQAYADVYEELTKYGIEFVTNTIER